MIISNPKVGCKHNLDRHVMFPDKSKFDNGDTLVLKCWWGSTEKCGDIVLNLKGQYNNKDHVVGRNGNGA